MELPRHPPVEMEFLYERIIKYLADKTGATDVSNQGVGMNFWEFVIDVTVQLMDHNCQKPSVYAKLLSICCRVCCSRVTFSTKLIPFLQWILQLSDEPILDIDISSARMDPKKMEKLLTSPYKYAHTVVNIEYDPVEMAVESGNVGLLELLLKYGAVPLWQDEWLRVVNLVVFLLKYHGGLPDDDRYDTSRLCYESLSCKELLGEQQIRRIYLVAEVLRVVGHMASSPAYAQRYAATLRLLWKSIPEPIVTSREIQDTIQRVLFGHIPYDAVSAVCKRFEEHFPEIRQPPSPRSLKHLSRCQVRDSLRLAESFPTGVNSLPLPRKLKEYVLLKEDRYLECNPIVEMMSFRYPFATDNILYNLPMEY